MAIEYKQLNTESVGTTGKRKIHWYLADGVKYGVLDGVDGVGVGVLDSEYHSIALDDGKKSIFKNVILHHLDQQKKA